MTPNTPEGNESSLETAIGSLSEAERQIVKSLRAMRFGTLQITVHEGRIVQIERGEKVRFDSQGRPISESLS